MNYDRTLIVIRERSFLELLDLALVVVRNRPVPIALAAVFGIAPFAALNFWLLADPAFPRVLWPIVLLMEVPWATAPLTIVLGDLMFGAPLRVGRIIKVLGGSLPVLLVTQLLVRGLLLMIAVGFLLVPSRLCFLTEVVTLERQGVVRALGRSFAICRGYEGELIARSLGQIILGLTFALCFRNGLAAAGSVLGGGDLTWDQPALTDVGGVIFQLGVWIAIAYFGLVRFLCYIDRRIRLEGWEIELRLKGVGRALEERHE
jgi:hypothetical protein